MKKLTVEQRDGIFLAWEKSIDGTDDGILVDWLNENTEQEEVVLTRACPECNGEMQSIHIWRWRWVCRCGRIE